MENSPETAALMAAAEQVRQQLALPAFNAAAVAELTLYIEAQRGRVAPAERESVVAGLGCLLGECLVQVYDGEWAAGRDGSTGVGLAGRLFFNPFYLVNSQFEKGLSASVAQFFSSVPARLAAGAGAKPRRIS